MRVIFTPHGCDGDTMIVETNNIVLTDDILSYSDCNEDCEHCVAVKIPGVFFVYEEDGEDMTAVYPFDIRRIALIEAAKIGVLDLTRFETFVDDSPEEIVEYLKEKGLSIGSEFSKCREE